jgi:hypothetical protein
VNEQDKAFGVSGFAAGEEAHKAAPFESVQYHLPRAFGHFVSAFQPKFEAGEYGLQVRVPGPELGGESGEIAFHCFLFHLWKSRHNSHKLAKYKTKKIKICYKKI